MPNSPVVQKDGRWTIVRRKEVWEAVGPRIFDDHLDRFRKVAVEVLSERDPQFELEPDERFAASVYGKALKHSQELRKGVAETLALLRSFPDALTSCSHGKAEATAALAVRDILTDADSILNQRLSMLAEAAPDEFLDAVERATAADPSPFGAIYAQESAGVMGRNYMTGLRGRLRHSRGILTMLPVSSCCWVISRKLTQVETGPTVPRIQHDAVNEAISDPGKVPDLIERFPRLPNAVRSRLLEFLGSRAVSKMPEAYRRPLWEALVSLAALHRKYADADWAMAPEATETIENAASKLAPASPSLRHRRLFGGSNFDLFDEKGDYQEQRRILAEKREEAVNEIILASGIEGVVAFAQSVDSPWQVGITLGVVADQSTDAMLLPGCLVNENKNLEQFSAGSCGAGFTRRGGNGWTVRTPRVGAFLEKKLFRETSVLSQDMAAS